MLRIGIASNNFALIVLGNLFTLQYKKISENSNSSAMPIHKVPEYTSRLKIYTKAGHFKIPPGLPQT